MPVTIQPVFGSYDYAAGSAEVSEWGADEQPVRAPVLPAPRSDVARSLDGYLDPRVVTLRGVIGQDGGSDRETLRNLVDAFKWAHRPGRRNLYRETDRYLRNAQVESVTLGDDTGLSHVPYTVRFRCADPYWHSTTLDTDTWNPVPPPAAPTLAGAAAGGALGPGTYWVKITWVSAAGETRGSAVASVAFASGTTNKVTVTPPAAPAGVTGYHVYAAQGGTEPADTAKYRQNGAAVTAGTAFELTSLLTSGSTAPTSSTETRSLTNGGAATALPKFTLTASSSAAIALTLQNSTTGKSFSLAGSVSAGDVLVVDCDAQTVTLNGSNKLSYFSGTFFALDPGANTLALTLSGVSLTSIVTTWRERWL